MQSKINKKAIFIVIALIASLGVTLLAGGRALNLLSRASGGNFDSSTVSISQITANSATITFTTPNPATTIIDYGVNPTNLTLSSSDIDRTSHSIILNLLTPATTYYFTIKIGDSKYDNNGLPWTFTTSATLSGLPTPTKAAPLIRSATPTLTGAASISVVPTKPKSSATCSDVAKHMGSIKGSPNYDSTFDLNTDGVINSADMGLCSK